MKHVTKKSFYCNYFKISLFVLQFFCVAVVKSSLTSNNFTTFERSYKNVMVRQKRFLIFPKQGFIINSCGFGKQIVAGFPRGFNWILELDIFWPLPYESRIYTQAKDLLFGKNKVKPLIPPWLNEPKEPSYSTYKLFLTPKPTTPMPMSYAKPMNFHPSHSQKWEYESHNGEIFVPPSGWQENIHSRSWNPNNMSEYSNYYHPIGRSMEFEHHFDPDPRWENIYAQKDRQELYEIIHAGFKKIGIDTTACLQRTICEVKHFLLPKGRSLSHDIFRVIFSYPMHMDDKWAEAARVNNEHECSDKYGTDCPMSILDFFLHSGHIL